MSQKIALMSPLLYALPLFYGLWLASVRVFVRVLFVCVQAKEIAPAG